MTELLIIINLIVNLFVLVFSVNKLDNIKKFITVCLLSIVLLHLLPTEWRYLIFIGVLLLYVRNGQELLIASSVAILVIALETFVYSVVVISQGLILSTILELFYICFINFTYRIINENNNITTVKLVIVVNTILITLFYLNI